MSDTKRTDCLTVMCTGCPYLKTDADFKMWCSADGCILDALEKGVGSWVL